MNLFSTFVLDLHPSPPFRLYRRGVHCTRGGGGSVIDSLKETAASGLHHWMTADLLFLNPSSHPPHFASSALKI